MCESSIPFGGDGDSDVRLLFEEVMARSPGGSLTGRVEEHGTANDSTHPSTSFAEIPSLMAQTSTVTSAHERTDDTVTEAQQSSVPRRGDWISIVSIFILDDGNAPIRSTEGPAVQGSNTDEGARGGGEFDPQFVRLSLI